MNVDEFLLISQFLDLKATDVANLQPTVEPEEEASAPMLHIIDSSAATADKQAPIGHPIEQAAQPWGNQPEQLVRLAFALGCDLFLFLKTSELKESNVPETVKDPYAEGTLPIKLDAAFHQHNNPRYSETGLTLMLSFDALRECFFPWHAFEQVIFVPHKPAAQDPDSEPDEPERPQLRVIK